MTIVGGYNVYPPEADEVLLAHPAVKEAAPAGVPDAYVFLKEEQAIRSTIYLPIAVPILRATKHQRVYLVRELLQTVVGKIDRKALCKQLVKRQGRM